MNRKTAAGIVLCNPDINRLTDNINAIINQTDYVILADNGSDNIGLVDELKATYPDKLLLIKSKTNKGIAWALNRIFEKAEELLTDWVITLDQDSVCPDDIMKRYFAYLDDIGGREAGIGILCPTIVDKNTGVIEGGGNGAECVRRCITSGALTSCSGFRAVGGFDERMFIDGVDFDYCDRLWEAGYRVIRIEGIRLAHELGKMSSHRFLFKTVKVQNHGPKRKYYIVRNRFYLARKRRKPFSVFFSFCFALKFSATVILFESGKAAKIKAILRGIRDGLKMETGANNS